MFYETLSTTQTEDHGQERVMAPKVALLPALFIVVFTTVKYVKVLNPQSAIVQYRLQARLLSRIVHLILVP